MNPNPNYFAEAWLARVVALLAEQDIHATIAGPAALRVDMSAEGWSVNFDALEGRPWSWRVTDEEDVAVEICPASDELACEGSTPEAVAAWIEAALGFIDCVTDEERGNGPRR